MMPPVSALFLILLLTIAAYLTRICYRDPNTPKISYEKDNLFSGSYRSIKLYFPKILEYVHLISATVHIFFAATIHSIDTSPFCPHPENVDKKYFTWTPYTSVCLGLVLVAAPLRLLAYRGLGGNFTFELAKPNRLVTTGIYAYVQHPSYLPFFTLNMTTMMLLLPLDGWIGCFLPAWVVGIWQGARGYLILVFACIQAVGFWVRVRDEERMLKETFGKEWIKWHKRTARFVPGVF